MESTETPSSVRTLDGKYQLGRQLGEGGMGTVYEGVHLGTKRRVAVKVVSSSKLAHDSEVVQRFHREAMAAGSIESQHIGQVLDVGTDAATGSPYLVMELLVGEDMEKLLERAGPLPPDLALRIVAQACLGLRKAHESDIIHRDIKPANVFLAERDGDERVTKLVDFGIAKVRRDVLTDSRSRKVTETGALLGSPLYMSPEQAFGKKNLDHRTDIWSLGVVLYELLAGTAPHGHIETVGELIICICQQPARPIQELAPWVSPEAATVVHKALALAPLQRFASAQEMYEAIRALLPEGHAIHASMVAPLTAEARALVAPKMVMQPEMRAPSPSMVEVPEALLTPQTFALPSTVETVNISRRDEPVVVPTESYRSVAIGAAILALLLVGGTAAYVLPADGRPTVASAPATGLVAAPSEGPATPPPHPVVPAPSAAWVPVPTHVAPPPPPAVVTRAPAPPKPATPPPAKPAPPPHATPPEQVDPSSVR